MVCGGGRRRESGETNNKGAPLTHTPLPTHRSYGYMPHRIAASIYLHAAALAVKGVPFYGPPPTGAPRSDAAARDGAPYRWRVWAAARAWP